MHTTLKKLMFFTLLAMPFLSFASTYFNPDVFQGEFELTRGDHGCQRSMKVVFSNNGPSKLCTTQDSAPRLDFISFDKNFSSYKLACIDQARQSSNGLSSPYCKRVWEVKTLKSTAKNEYTLSARAGTKCIFLPVDWTQFTNYTIVNSTRLIIEKTDFESDTKSSCEYVKVLRHSSGAW